MEQIDKMTAQVLTTKAVAEKLGYSQQSVRNAIGLLNIRAEKAKSGYALTPEQADCIAEYFYSSVRFTSNDEEETQDTEQETQEPQGVPLLDSVVLTLQEQMKEKDKQIASLQSLLESKERQIDTLLETNKALSTSHAAKEVAETKELLIVDKTEEQPQDLSFWQRLKFAFGGKY